MSDAGHEAGHHAEHGGGHAEKKDHGKKMGWVKRLFSIITISLLLPAAGDLAKTQTLDPVKNTVTSGMGFVKGGGGHGGGGSHGGSHGHASH